MAQNRLMSASCSGGVFADYQPTPDDGLWEAGYMIFRTGVLIPILSNCQINKQTSALKLSQACIIAAYPADFSSSQVTKLNFCLPFHLYNH